MKARPLPTTTTCALGPETKTLFTCRSAHVRADFRPISARDCIVSSRPYWNRRTGCRPLMATGSVSARGLMASLSDSATVTSVLWDSDTSSSRVSGSQKGQTSQRSGLSVARTMGLGLSTESVWLELSAQCVFVPTVLLSPTIGWLAFSNFGTLVV